MTIGEKIRELRQRRGISQMGLARELGVAISTVQFWEYGTHFPRWAMLREMIALFDVTAEEFLEGIDVI